MSQQINLYNSAFLRRHEAISAVNLAIAVGALMTLLLTIYVALFVWAERRVAAAAADEVHLNEHRLRMAALIKARDERKPDPGLASDLEKIRAAVRAKQEIADLIDAGVPGTGKGYAEYMRALARQVTPGLWLTGFVFGDAGKRMEIRGRMVAPDALPEFIARLNGEEVFKGHSFASLNIAPAQETMAPALADAASPEAPTPASTSAVIDFWLASEGSSSFVADKKSSGDKP